MTNIAATSRNDVTFIKRQLHRIPDLAVMGDETGAVDYTPDPGVIYARKPQAGGGFGPPFLVRGPTIPMSRLAGKPIQLGPDNQGKYRVLDVDYAGLRVLGVNPTQDAANDPNANNNLFINQAYLTTGYGQIVETTLKVAIRGWLALDAGVWYKFEGQADFTGNVPSASSHCAAIVAVLRDYSGLEVQYSTAKSTGIPLDTDDLNEAWALMSDATNTPIASFDIGDGITELVEANRWLDIRQLINLISSSGTGTVTSVALTMPSIFSVAGSPVTTAGTLAVTLQTESANVIFAGPSTGSPATPTFRSLVVADIPALSYAPVGATYITQTHDATLTSEQALSDLATGILKSTTATGVVSIAAAGTDYTSPTGTENVSNKTITASTLIATALSLLIGGFKAIFSHANTADRTYTFPDATGNVLIDTATQNASNKTITSSSLNSTPIGASSASTAIVTALSILIGGFKAIFTHANSADRTYTLRDETGTLQMQRLTTKGDLLSYGSSDQRVGVGSDGQAVVAQAAQTPGLYWRDVLYPKNEIINGGFSLWQRQAVDPTSATSYSDDSYSADQWYILTQTGAVTDKRRLGPLTSDFGAELNQSQASAQRIGRAQIIEGVHSQPYRSRPIRFSCKVLSDTASTVIRVAILDWLGTADAVISDVVNDWTSGTFTPGNFFLSSGNHIGVIGTANVTVAASTWTDLVITGTVSSVNTNIIVFVWTENVLASGKTFAVSECVLCDGVDPVPFIPPDYQAESIRAQRFLKVFYGANGNKVRLFTGMAIDATSHYRFLYTPPVPFRVVPTLTATATDWQVLITSGVDLSALSLDTLSTVDQIILDATTGAEASQSIWQLGSDSSADRYMILSAEL